MASQQDSTEILLGTVYFDSAGKVLTPESEIILKRIANKLLTEPNLMIDVCGYIHNAGSLSANTVLSQKMADQVKNYLTINLGLSGDKIQTFGSGAKDLIASNETKEGRKNNHRVKIVIRQPDAVLTWFKNDVKVQPPSLRPGWLNPVPNYYLYHGYKVTTGKKSSAHILYPNKSVLRMDEDAMVIIQGLNPKRKEKPIVKNIELQDGGLKAILKDAASQHDSIMSTPVAVSGVHTQSSDTLVDEKLEDLVVVYQRNAEVSAASEKTVTDRGEGTVVKQGEVLEEHRPPPIAPVLVSPQINDTKFLPDDIVFVWQSSGVFSHLQVAEDSFFQELALDTYAASDSLVTSLRENLYYWRVSEIDEDSLEGEYSDCWTFVVETDTSKPQLEVVISRGVQEDQLIVAGHTDIDAELYIDDERIKKEKDGLFSYTMAKDYQGTSVVVKAVDNAGNVIERRCKIPGMPAFMLGVNAGLCRMGSHKRYKAEQGFWYGLEFSRMLLPSINLFLSTAMANSKREKGKKFYETDIIPVEIGFRKKFSLDRLSPFFHVRLGFAWWQRSMVREVIHGAVDDSAGAVNPTIGFGVGSWLHMGRNWFLNLQADYTHFFNDGNDSQNARTLTRFGFGVKYRM